MPAGAKLIDFFARNENPAFRIAVRTRSLLSCTTCVGRPTIVIPGNPRDDTSTSTSTGMAWIPEIVAENNVESITALYGINQFLQKSNNLKLRFSPDFTHF
jgi:hypothetical protein